MSILRISAITTVLLLSLPAYADNSNYPPRGGCSLHTLIGKSSYSWDHSAMNREASSSASGGFEIIALWNSKDQPDAALVEKQTQVIKTALNDPKVRERLNHLGFRRKIYMVFDSFKDLQSGESRKPDLSWESSALLPWPALSVTAGLKPEHVETSPQILKTKIEDMELALKKCDTAVAERARKEREAKSEPTKYVSAINTAVAASVSELDDGAR